MRKIAGAAVLMAALCSAAYAQTTTTTVETARVMTSLPADAVTVTNYYKQNIYDPSDTKIGDVADVLVDKTGRVVGMIISVGGFLGAGEKDVAIPFEAVRVTQKDGKTYLVVNATKDALKAAPGYKYDRTKTQWIADGK
ncbi:photosystem reaction center subunit H [Afipia sp. P52-10]|uniref:PRC-barrel domain-containing protein n=1 Tax=Afipia sp. P52-10 TaxID=1429916 RepID=UPI0003DF1D2D|nr:PRC-barrel domain-containing protein [Afipia sp. P52-10]ETR76374.1 photosystem reaction center subunit H [Afipia sp. P52-10]